MAKEIERKFLVDRNCPELARILSTSSVQIRQGYLKSDARGVARVRIYGSKGYLTIKGPTSGISRDEFEYEIPRQDAEAMLATMCGAVIAKARYTVPLPDGLMVEIDVFEAIDLIMAEIELPSEEADFHRPTWLGEEVSHDPAYFNNAIAERLCEGVWQV